MKEEKSDLLPFVPEGTYTLAYVHHETGKYFGQAAKLVIWFRITDIGQYFGTLLPRFYSVQRLIGKHGRNGRFKAGRSGDFVRDFARAFGVAPPRLDRIPMSLFQKELIKADVRTVTRDRNQKELAAIIRYSVIQDLQGVVQR